MSALRSSIPDEDTPAPVVLEKRSGPGRDVLALMGAQGLSHVLAFAWMALLVRTLAQSDFGLFSVAAAITALAFALADPGISAISTRELSITPAKANALVADALVLRVALALLAILVIVLYTVIAGYGSREMLVTVLFATSLLTDTGRGACCIVFRSVQKLGLEAAVLLVFRITAFASAAFILFGGFDIYIAIAAYILSGIVSSFLAFRLMRGVGVVPDWRATRWQTELQMLRESLPLGLALFLTQVYFRIDVLLLSRLTDLREVAIYSSAYRINDAMRTVEVPAALALFPVLARLGKVDRVLAADVVARTIGSLAVFWAPAVLGFTLLATILVRLLYGGDYAEAASPLAILSLTLPLFLLNGLLNYLMLAIGKTSRLLLNSALLCVVNIGLNLVLIPQLQSEGAAIATVLTEVCLAALNLGWLLRNGVLDARRWAQPLGLITAVSTASWALMLLAPSDAVRILLCCAIGVATLIKLRRLDFGRGSYQPIPGLDG